MQALKRLASALKAGLRMLSPNCREASRLQSEALDQPLSLPQRLGLRLHLLICKWCRRYALSARRAVLHSAIARPSSPTPALIPSLCSGFMMN